MSRTKVIDVILRLKDDMTKPLSGASKRLQEHAREYQRIGRDIQRTGKKIYSAGATLTKTITAPAVALGAVAFKEYGEYDKQMRLVQQTMGATDEESKLLSESIKESAQNSVYGMQDAADAALNYARAGYDAKQAADMISPAFNLAAGTATDLSVVTAGLSSTMKAFEADTSEAARYTDVLAQAQAQAATTVTDLFDSTAKASSMFKTAGWDISDLATATGVLGDAYISGAEAGNALKSGIASLVKPETINYMKKLGIEITNADGTFKTFAETQEILHDAFESMTPVMKTQTATSIFGKNQMAKWLKIIERSPQDIQNMETALSGATDTAQGMSDALMEGPGGAIERLKSNWDIFKNTLGETVAPVITPLIEKLTEMLQVFSAMDEAQKQNIVKWVAIVAAVGPVLMVVGKLIIGVGKLFTTMGNLGKAVETGTGIFKIFSGVSKGAMLGSLGAIGIAIGVVIRNWDKITEKVGNFYQKVKPSLDKIMAAFDKVFGFVADVIDAIAMPALDSILGALDGLLQSLGGVIDFLTGIFTADWEKAWDGLVDIVMGAVNSIDQALDGLFSKHMSNILDLFGVGISDQSAEKNQKLRKYFYDNDLMNKGYELKSNFQGKVYIADKRGENIPLPFEDELAHLASGTQNWRGGIVQVNERGGEIIDLPVGSRVYPHDESVKMAYQDGYKASGDNNVTITIPKLADKIIVREDADIDKIAKKLAHRLEKVSQNIGGSRIDYAFQS